MAKALPWVAIDLETTGLHPAYHHRAIEIAMITGEGSSVTEEWTTLLYPDRDVGAGEIHGLFGRELSEAPRFHEVVGAVLDRLRSRVVVAHNTRFEESFIAAEMARCQIDLPKLPWICTMELSRLRGARSGRLADCCRDFGIEHEDPHSATGDARACAHLWMKLLEARHPDAWPSRPELPQRPVTAPVRPRGQAPVPVRGYLADLAAARPPLAVDDGASSAYLELLDRVLEDRRVTSTEADELALVAADFGLSSAQVLDAHRVYMSALVKQALADSIVTAREQRDLDLVAELLGVGSLDPSGTVDITWAQAHGLVGKSVCFTGTLLCEHAGVPITRERAHELAVRAGLRPARSVTAALDLLVVADPNSLSGKARKAKALGTRVIAETAFWRMIGVEVA